MSSKDWRLPENRREAFLRFYGFHLKYKSHPGMVYSFLPAIAEAYDLDEDGKAWLAWLNGNTQNPAMSLLLLEAAPTHHQWQRAVDFWNEHFKLMDFDTDRRHQKSKFGEATEKWYALTNGSSPAVEWYMAGNDGWEEAWRYSNSQPYMGRLSAWSMMEYARILLGDGVPDMGSWLLEDKSGSRSHRNGIAVVAGYDATYWEADVPDMLGIVDDLNKFADNLLNEAEFRFRKEPFFNDIGRLTMESALCTYKSWHKPNRRYPNVYADMAYNRLKKAEARFGAGRFDILWEARRRDLPDYLRLEDNLCDPGLVPMKQNHYLNSGQVIMMEREYDDMDSSFAHRVSLGEFGIRKDPKW
jgi:hypothetical protein